MYVFICTDTYTFVYLSLSDLYILEALMVAFLGKLTTRDRAAEAPLKSAADVSNLAGQSIKNEALPPSFVVFPKGSKYLYRKCMDPKVGT